MSTDVTLLFYCASYSRILTSLFGAMRYFFLSFLFAVSGGGDFDFFFKVSHQRETGNTFIAGCSAGTRSEAPIPFLNIIIIIIFSLSYHEVVHHHHPFNSRRRRSTVSGDGIRPAAVDDGRFDGHVVVVVILVIIVGRLQEVVPIVRGRGTTRDDARHRGRDRRRARRGRRIRCRNFALCEWYVLVGRMYIRVVTI